MGQVAEFPSFIKGISDQGALQRFYLFKIQSSSNMFNQILMKTLNRLDVGDGDIQFGPNWVWHKNVIDSWCDKK